MHVMLYVITKLIFQGHIYVADATNHEDISMDLLLDAGYGKFISICNAASLPEYVVVRLSRC